MSEREDEVERAACWAGRKPGGGGERVFSSRLRELFARILVARVVFIKGARTFKHILIEVCGKE